MTISKKEIMYLKWLGLFIVVYGFWTFVWTPMSNTLSQKQTQLADLKFAQTVALATIPTYDSVVKQEIDAREKADGLFSKFFDVQTPAQTEATLIPILTQHQGRITFFEVTAATVVIPQTTLQTKEQLTYKIKELVDQYNEITVPSTTLPVTESQLLKTQITYLVSISFANYQNLLKTIDDADQSIILSATDYDMKDSLARLVFDIYAIEKIKLTD